MTAYLQALVNDWNDEKAHYDVITSRWLNSVKSLTSLNKLIYDQCVKEGIDIKSLNLTPNEDEKEQKEKTGSKKRSSK